MLWYIRESSTAVYVSNLPMLWPLFRRVFKFGTFADSSNKYHERADSLPLSNISKKKSTMNSFAGSEERINKGLEIEQRFSFAVEEGKAGYDVTVRKGSDESQRMGHRGEHVTTITAGSSGLK